MGDPADPVDFLECLGPQSVGRHADEPLLGGAEDYRLLAAPAMGIGMADFADAQKHAGFRQLFDDALVGFEYLLAGEEFHVLHEPAPVVDRVVDVQPEAQPHFVVVLAMTGRRVNAAGACLQGYMLAEENDRIPIVERMTAVFLFQHVCREGRDHVPGNSRACTE